MRAPNGLIRYRARFYGRRKGAIGIFYWIEVWVHAEDEAAARLRLYDWFEHVQQLTLSVGWGDEVSGGAVSDEGEITS